jgi:hypothetical protein
MTEVEIDVTDQLRHLAFEYFICRGRVLPVPSPRFRVTPGGGLEMLLPGSSEADDDLWVACDAPEAWETSPQDLLDAYTSGKSHSYAYLLSDRAGQLHAIIAFAPTKEQAEHDADLRLVEAFVDEVGEQRASRLLLAWIERGPGLLTTTRPTDPCPCGSGRKYRKCCGRGKP